MSTYSEAWHSMDPDLRNFYVSWAQINTAQNWHVEYWELYEMWVPILLDTLYRVGALGYHVAQRNWGIQLFETGSFDKNTILLNVPLFSQCGLLEPRFDVGELFSYESFGNSYLDLATINIYVDPPTDPPTEEDPVFWASNLPRLKYKIRRSYWTGAPRRRRNL
jgi:hypothetical protein